MTKEVPRLFCIIYLSAAVKISYRDAITIVHAWLHHESNG